MIEDRSIFRKLDIVLPCRCCMQKCSCGRDLRTFEACTPTGCNTFFVCTGCFKNIGECSCKPT